ncbi:MAG: PA domain-containing protein, partial [Acidobacteriota bacterium]
MAGDLRQRELEQELASLVDTSILDRHFRHLTAEPHPAGSARNEELARYVRDRFQEFGLEDVQLFRYDVLLDSPRQVHVQMIEPFAYEASMKEAAYAVDEDTSNPAVGIPYLSMSAPGEVTADLIYAHSGNPEDYDYLESQGIDVRGKIAIVRYSVPYSYRGFKAFEAQRRGVAALLIYSDPLEDGFHKGEVFPDGPWGPESHIQRGAVTYDFLVPGDPLTPGWASLVGASRIPRQQLQRYWGFYSSVARG